MKKTLFAKDGRGEIRVWNIEEQDDGLYITHGVLGGQLQEKYEEIDEGLASRSLEEQIRSRFNSRISKKIDSGYVESEQIARNSERTNALGFKKPMLAQRFDKIKTIDYENLFVQYKYDGNRMLIRNENGINIAYTRQGKIIDTVPEILDGIVIPEGMTIDGEIYAHGESLQTIVSWVKRRQENSKKLRFHAYDIMTDDHYGMRLERLASYELGEFAEVVPTTFFDGELTVKDMLKRSIAQGYEGLILRQNDFGYESKRSKGLIKVKQFFDGEFKITNIHLSKDGIPVMDCVTEYGVSFKATAPGTFKEKMKIYESRSKIIGLHTHIEYAQLTKDNVPFHAVATSILMHEMFNK